MTREADAQSARNAEKDLNGRVTAMIDGAGGWMSCQLPPTRTCPEADLSSL